MKTVLSNLLLFFIVQNTEAQVSGKLIIAGGRPIPYANVLLLNSTDSTLVKAALTNETGTYSIKNIAPGTYLLKVSCIGYQTWFSAAFALTPAHRNEDMGTLIMTENKKQLSEVVVRAEKPVYQQSPAGTIVNVESSVLSKGSSALEVLERSPGVVIDRHNNSIALNGKNGVTVMLNGRLLRMPIDQLVNLLNGLSANDIEKIELLTTPPAQYDAEGNAGIINIVLKKNRRQGTHGTVSVTAGHGWGEKGNASINLTHNTKNVSLYGSYSFLHDHTRVQMFIPSSQNMPVFGGPLSVLVYDTSTATQNTHDVNAGFDLKLNTATAIGGSINWNNSARLSTDRSRSDFTLYPDSLLYYRGYISGTNHWKNFIGALYAEHTLREGETVHAEAEYLRFANDNPSVVQSRFVDGSGTQAGNNDSLFAPSQRGIGHTLIQVGVLKADYTKQLHKNWKLETGVKGTFTKSNSASAIESLINGVWVGRTETINHVMMKESIGAAYAAVTGKMNATTNLVIGLRYEQAVTNMTDPQTKERLIIRRAGVLFPNIAVTKKLSEQSELQLSYSKRISRPSYTDLASFVRYSDPTAVYTGNPLLKPTITHNVKLGYNYKSYVFSVLFSRDINPIARYQLTESPQKELLYVSPQNGNWQNNVVLQAALPWKINNWWNMNYALTGGWRQFSVSYTIRPVTKTYYNWSGNFTQSFKLPKQFTMELSGWYYSWFYNGTIKVGGMGTLNAGIKKELKNNWGTLQLAVSDFLRTMQVNVQYGTITKEAFAITNHVRLDLESRLFPVIKLTYTKSFGIATPSAAKKAVGAEEERQRITSQ